MKSYERFISEAPTEAQAAKMAPGMSPEKRRAALEKNARNQAKRTTPPTPNKPKAALPPGKPGGSIEKAQSSQLDKKSPGAIVKKPSSAMTRNDVQKVNVSVDDMSSQRGKRPGTTRPEPKQKKPFKMPDLRLKDFAKDMAKGAYKNLRRHKTGTRGDRPTITKDASVKEPPRNQQDKFARK